MSYPTIGDLAGYLFAPDGSSYSTLFAPPGDDAASVNGTYTFLVDPTAMTIDEAAAGKSASYTIPTGTYALSDFGDGVNPGPRSDFSAMAGQSLDGTWTLEIDNYGFSAGTLTSWGFTANAVTPEPTSIVALGAAGLILRRRK